ncbi:MAG: UvrD-helicase domain-containing protein [bacterium]
MTVAEDQLLAHLNPIQQQAVESTAPALLVIAGAGTGKTRVLTHRIAYLIASRGVKPSAILACTFTNKAAHEMVERIANLTRGRAGGLMMGTFHRVCARFLRDFPTEHRYGSNFAIWDDSEQLSATKAAMRDVHLDPKQYEPRAMHSRISHFKSLGMTVEDFLEDDGIRNFLDEKVALVYPRYQSKLRAAKALDFDDLILEGTRLVRNRPRVHAQIRSLFQWVFIDEFQDINQAQWQLITAIAGLPGDDPTPANIFAVGDDDQAIYGFRGAHAGFLDDFQLTYKPVEVIMLEDNYRSTEQILKVANKVIEGKSWGPVKQLRSHQPPGVTPWAFVAHSDHEEALSIGEQIEHLVRRGEAEQKEIAILYRQNAQSRVFEEVFTRMAIPHQVIGGQRFYQRQEIKDVVAYLRLLNNDRDTAALERAINTPRRGIGERTLEQLKGLLESEEIGLAELTDRANELLRPFPNRARVPLLGFLDLMATLRDQAGKVTLPELLAMVLEQSGYEQSLRQSKSIEDEARIDNLDELRGAVADWSELYPAAGLAEYLEEQALIADQDSYNADRNNVTLMTLHAAKGLEFKVVFLVGLEENVLPHFRAIAESSFDEELRLAYVGLTRARERLVLSAAKMRRARGETRQNPPSRFFRGLDSTLIEGHPLDLIWLTSELAGPGWSQGGERAIGWRRQMDADAAYADMGGRKPEWGATEPWSDSLDVAEPLPGERLSQRRPLAGARAIGPSTGKPAAPSPPREPSKFMAGAQVQHATFGTGTVKEIRASGSDHMLTIDFGGEVGRKVLMESKAPLVEG